MKKNDISRFTFFSMSLKCTYTQIDEGTQRAIANDYQHGARGHGIRANASKYGITEFTVRHMVERSRQHGGDPVTERGHKKRKLSPAAEGKLLQALKANPSASNTNLARAVDNVIKPRLFQIFWLGKPPVLPLRCRSTKNSVSWPTSGRPKLSSLLRRSSVSHCVPACTPTNAALRRT